MVGPVEPMGTRQLVVNMSPAMLSAVPPAERTLGLTVTICEAGIVDNVFLQFGYSRTETSFSMMIGPSVPAYCCGGETTSFACITASMT